MKLEKIKLGDKQVMPLTIPSGIVMTDPECAADILQATEELGIWTTKSIGPEPRAGNREPIIAQPYEGCFVNAVGLTNPGAVEFRRKLIQAQIPEDRFVLASIFGKNAQEFVQVAETLEDVVDGFELNLSCPHAKGHGMALGQDPETVYEITKAVCDTTRKPVLAKLTPNTEIIGQIARAAVSGGAYGIAAINTAGPIQYEFNGSPILSNKVGGKSGKWVQDLALQRTSEIRQALPNTFLLAMAGISNADDIREFQVQSKANAFAIGSALAGLTSSEISDYFATLVRDLELGTNDAQRLLRKVDMTYHPVQVKEVIQNSCDFKIYRTSSSIQAEPGQFVFAYIPGIGEKPFSVMDTDPLTLGVLTRGEFTKEFNKLQQGDNFYFRGPYGKPLQIPDNSDIVLVGGGCGIAGLYLPAKRFARNSNLKILLGARDRQHIPFLDHFSVFGQVSVATEDGSLGKRGKVTDLFNQVRDGSYFINCGPKQMVNAVFPLESAVSEPTQIYSSLDYMTKCGIGLCGSCADETGKRTCVEGLFMKA